MNKLFQLLKMMPYFMVVLMLSACGGGGSSSSTPASSNFTRLTPNGGVNVNNIATSQGSGLLIDNHLQATNQATYTTFGTNKSTLYAGTSAGQILQMNSTYTGWTEVAQAPESIPIITIAANDGNGVYYAPFQSTVAYSTTGSGFTNGLDEGFITAITSSSNNSIYFGTSLGNVGLTDNPADKLINTIPNPKYGPIISIGCTSGSCNSGQQGVLVLQAESNIIPPFESTVYESSPSAYNYLTQMYYLLIHGAWVSATYNNIISSSNTVTVESVAYTHVPEFVTTITIDAKTSKLYAGTNFFNIYIAVLNCNPGQGCDITWGSSPINTIPLGTVSNGTQGITSIAVLPDGSLYAVGNNSESVINVYQSNSTNN